MAVVFLFNLGLTACTDKPDAIAFDFVVLADTAYSVPEDYPAYYRLIERINRAAPAFTVHLGDTKSGGTDCGDEAQRKIKADFHQFDHPLIYTPGDNEWTDCHGEAAGGYDPQERLAAIRQLFFSDDRSLGQKNMPVQRQSGPDMPENALWWQGDVLFATVHIVGSNNGLTAEADRDPESARITPSNG